MLNIKIGAEQLFILWHLPVTNTLLMTWGVVILLIIVARIISKNMSAVPSPLQNIVEYAVESLLSFMEKVLGTREKAQRYFPLVATIFTLVLVSNWMGVVPGVGSIGLYTLEGGQKVLTPFLRSGASDLNFTLAIALISVVVTNIYGIAAQGWKNHTSHYISFKSPVDFFVGILELIGEFAKMISFSFRLFGNVFAGEVLLIITGFLVPYIVPIPFLGLELFVGFIQALVFATLTLVFISIAVADHSEEHAHE